MSADEVLEKAKAKGVSTCIDTAAGPFTREEPWFGRFQRLMAVTDLFILDLKHIDPVAHRELTGKDNANVLDCARYLSEIDKSVWIRHVLVPGVTSDDATIEALATFIKSLRNVQRIDILPYHTFGVPKWEALGLPYGLKGVEPPTDELLAHVRQCLDKKTNN